MDPVSAFALEIVIAGAFLYAIYWVVRKAVAAGRMDAHRDLEQHGAAQAAWAHDREGGTGPSDGRGSRS